MFRRFSAILVILVVQLVACNAAVISEADPVVEIENGKIRGKFHGHFYSFESIRYAEPPIGANRFESPKPFREQWDGVRNATTPPNQCIQWSGLPLNPGEYLVGEEDCLTVNVYAPVVKDGELLPVMFYIHGGGFNWGSADFYKGDTIMKHGSMVFVTFNYRLGPLGFLSTEDEQISGNMGLKDQALALKWTKENIRSFNGDPDKITLTGFSAGGTSVHLHLLSETSKGLMSSAVSFSGNALGVFVNPPKQLAKARKLAKHLNCPKEADEDTSVLKACLKEKSAEDIVSAVPNFLKIFYNPWAFYCPTVEKATVKDAFITEDVTSLMKAGKTAKIPWLLSYTVDDGGYNAAEWLQRDENGADYIEKLDKEWKDLAPYLLFYNELSKEEQDKRSEDLRRKYFGDKKMTRDTYKQLQKMFTDVLFREGLEQAVELYSNYSQSPVYAYKFDVPQPFGIGNILSKRMDYEFGSVHGDDVFMIFDTVVRSGRPLNDAETKVSNALIEMIEGFARTGVPKYNGSELPRNTPFTGSVQFLHIKAEESNSNKIEKEEF